jgi:hypothetical protein
MPTFHYQYVEPPEPAEYVPSPGEVAIEVPEKEGTSVTVLTYHNGMTFYAHRVWHDWDAARRMAMAIEEFLDTSYYMFGVEPSSMPEKGRVYIPRKTIETLLNVHDEVVQSPLARPQSGGKRIIVPGPNDIIAHGPGKRRRR